MKILCRKCGIHKHMDLFSKESKGRFGRKTICKDCANKENSVRYLLNIDRERQRCSEYRKKNPEKWIEYARRWERNNPDDFRKSASIRTMRWRKNHPEKASLVGCIFGRLRKQKLKSNFPKWANKHLIATLYKAAKDKTAITGIKHVVDHIVPLRGKTVCGLHCENNLRVITEKQNQEKSNKVWPDMP